ncbi:Pol polyprotein [Plakobranchus ocellatus]|uniref:Pol polyprotein n=1 Tax=Plakobranchus ocellatus TaxID=259542 RepID=A0AAV4B542_9GAST|nr:Pol polyprotein [Plakobranchus ocellatus]
MCGRTGHYAQNCRSRLPKDRSSGKRKTPAVSSQSIGGQEQGSLADEAFGNCPVATAHIDLRPVKALLDTGSQVSVMTEKFYRSHLRTATDINPAALKFNLTAANGTNIPYKGYLSVRVDLLGTTVEDAVIFITKKLTSTDCILGMNIPQHIPMFSECVDIHRKWNRNTKIARSPKTPTHVPTHSIVTNQASGPATTPFNPSDSVPMSEQQEQDTTIQPVRAFLRPRRKPNFTERAALPRHAQALLTQWKRLRFEDNVLVRTVVGPEGEISQVVLPAKKQKEACQLAHDSCGHQGPERTLQTLRKRFFWPGMHHDVFDYCRRCHRCQVAKAPAQTTFRASAHITANDPLEMIAIDFTQMEMSYQMAETQSWS